MGKIRAKELNIDEGVSFNNNKLTSLADASVDSDAVNLKVLKENILVNNSTASTITFTKDAVFGEDTPLSGDLVIDNGNAVFGTVVLVHHLDSVIPDLGSEATIILGSYKENVLNYIYMQRLNNEILTTISQKQN